MKISKVISLVAVSVMLATPQLTLAQDRSGETGEVGRNKDRGGESTSGDGISSGGHGYDDYSNTPNFDEPIAGADDLAPQFREVSAKQIRIESLSLLRAYVQSLDSSAVENFTNTLSQNNTALAVGAGIAGLGLIVVKSLRAIGAGAIFVSAGVQASEAFNAESYKKDPSLFLTDTSLRSEDLVYFAYANNMTNVLDDIIVKAEESICTNELEPSALVDDVCSPLL